MSNQHHDFRIRGKLKTIYENPTHKEMKSALANSNYRIGKGLINESGNHYFWVDDDPLLTHNGAKSALKIPHTEDYSELHYHLPKGNERVHVGSEDGFGSERASKLSRKLGLVKMTYNSENSIDNKVLERAGFVQFPSEITKGDGARCSTCEYSSTCCNYWDHPGTKKASKAVLNQSLRRSLENQGNDVGAPEEVEDEEMEDTRNASVPKRARLVSLITRQWKNGDYVPDSWIGKVMDYVRSHPMSTDERKEAARKWSAGGDDGVSYENIDKVMDHAHTLSQRESMSTHNAFPYDPAPEEINERLRRVQQELRYQQAKITGKPSRSSGAAWSRRNPPSPEIPDERQAFETLIRREPNNPDHRLNYADWLERRGDFSEAESHRRVAGIIQEQSEPWTAQEQSHAAISRHRLIYPTNMARRHYERIASIISRYGGSNREEIARHFGEALRGTNNSRIGFRPGRFVEFATTDNPRGRSRINASPMTRTHLRYVHSIIQGLPERDRERMHAAFSQEIPQYRRLVGNASSLQREQWIEDPFTYDEEFYDQNLKAPEDYTSLSPRAIDLSRHARETSKLANDVDDCNIHRMAAVAHRMAADAMKEGWTDSSNAQAQWQGWHTNLVRQHMSQAVEAMLRADSYWQRGIEGGGYERPDITAKVPADRSILNRKMALNVVPFKELLRSANQFSNDAFNTSKKLIGKGHSMAHETTLKSGLLTRRAIERQTASDLLKAAKFHQRASKQHDTDAMLNLEHEGKGPDSPGVYAKMAKERFAISLAHKMAEHVLREAALRTKHTPTTGAYSNNAAGISRRSKVLGVLAKREIDDKGHNPVSWVKDESKWKKAKDIVGSRYGGDNSSRHWAVVAHIYEKMGGRIKGHKQTQNQSNVEESLAHWLADKALEKGGSEDARSKSKNAQIKTQVANSPETHSAAAKAHKDAERSHGSSKAAAYHKMAADVHSAIAAKGHQFWHRGEQEEYLPEPISRVPSSQGGQSQAYNSVFSNPESTAMWLSAKAGQASGLSNNPKAVNSTVNAHKLSRRAYQTRNSEDYNKAATAHEQAASLHGDVHIPGTSGFFHNRSAIAHRQLANIPVAQGVHNWTLGSIGRAAGTIATGIGLAASHGVAAPPPNPSRVSARQSARGQVAPQAVGPRMAAPAKQENDLVHPHTAASLYSISKQSTKSGSYDSINKILRSKLSDTKPYIRQKNQADKEKTMSKWIDAFHNMTEKEKQNMFRYHHGTWPTHLEASEK